MGTGGSDRSRGAEFMIRWLGLNRRAQIHRDQPERPDEARAALEVALGGHERLVNELERATAAHRVVAKNLRAQITALAFDHESEAWEAAARERDEEDAAFGQYSIAARLFGPFEVSVGGTPVRLWRSQRAASLLKYLLFHHDRPVRREALMDAFWPFSTAPAARNNLNVAVHSLRRTLSFADPEHPHIVYRNGVYLLNPGLRCWIDVREYSATCRRGHRCFETGDLARAITAYLHARRLYRGPVMEGDVSGEWFRDDELRLRDQHHSVLERLGTGLLQHGDLSASVDVARELVSADPCRETGHQLLMRGYAALQQPQLVVRQYRQCVDVLHRELSVEPHETTRALLGSLVSA
jgi:DNA-binding SARP family transcriptional activator